MEQIARIRNKKRRRSLRGVDDPLGNVLTDFLPVGVPICRMVQRDAFVGAANQDVGFEKTFVGKLDESG
jgi:hypothetical protein